jgi:hypothetical protein
VIVEPIHSIAGCADQPFLIAEPNLPPDEMSTSDFMKGP